VIDRGDLPRITLAALLILATSSAPAQQPLQAPATSHIEVNLVLLDAVVTDKKGNPIPGLHLDDFDLLIDNVRSPIYAVEQSCEPRTPQDHKTEGSAQRAGGRYILYFDMSHLKLTARRNSLKAALRYVEQMMEPDDQVMILAFMKGLRIVTSFTSDRSVLQAKLESVIEDRALIDPAPFEEENTLDRFASAGRGASAAAARGLRGLPGPLFGECANEARLAEIDTARAIRAMANAVPAFSSLPGRKALIFFSETLRANPGLPLYEACGMNLFDQPSLGLTVQPEMIDLVKRANLAGVSFYSVHGGGMLAGRTTSVMSSAVDLQTSLSLDTGGQAFILMNNPLGVFEQAKKDLSCYYLLSYRPPEGFRSGRHAIKVSMRDSSLKVRHRDSFVIQSESEAGKDQMMAVLSSPGLYRDLKVETHGYTLADAEGKKRQFLVKASVALQDLALVPRSESIVAGGVLIRGGIVSKGKLQCEFTDTLGFERARSRETASGEAGVEALCALDEGEHEIVVAGRDENGGALGAFWGKIQVKSPELRGGYGALLWAGAGHDVWHRHEGAAWLPSGAETAEGGAPEPYFIRRDLTMTRDEPAAITFVACRDGEKEKGARTSDEGEGASVRLDGPSSPLLPAMEMTTGGGTTCRIFRSEISARSLSPGEYHIVPRPPVHWMNVGASLSITVKETTSGT
jgi:VWFA-related protein